MKRTTFFATIALLVSVGLPGATQSAFTLGPALPAAPLLYWSNEARRAIVPAGPNGILGPENYGNKFPGEAAVYMGIVHAALHDAAVEVTRRSHFRAFARDTQAPSPEAAIATAAHHVLVGLQPALGLTPAQQALLDERYEAYLSGILESRSKEKGIAIGERAASAVLAERTNDGREVNPLLSDLNPPPPGPGVWVPDTTPAVGLRMPGIKPLALESGSQFRPEGPTPLLSAEYADDFEEVKALGRADSATRTPAQTAVALFWTDHDLRQWNDGMIRLAVAYNLNLVQTATMLGMAHVAGGDAMIACFDAKYAYWFWRPYQAVPGAELDENPATDPDPAWRPLGGTPSFPEYPSAHSCHSAAMAEALSAFFGTDRVPITLDSRMTGATRVYARLRQVVREVETARVLVGFHFRSSDLDGSRLGRRVARYVVAHRFKHVSDRGPWGDDRKKRR
jgi:hypothetical protein